MKTLVRFDIRILLLALCGFIFSVSAAAQVVSNSGSITPPSSRVGQAASPLTADNSIELTNSQEAADFKAFSAISSRQLPKKIKAGENFLKKYTESVVRWRVFAQLAVAYIQAGDPDKGLSAGVNAIQLNPNDIRTMGVLCQAMARTASSGAPDSAKRLDQAEKFGKEALSVAPTLAKLDTVTDQAFTDARNEALTMAHSGLGLVSVLRGNYAQAIPDLQDAVELDSKKDPANFYLLGVANQNSHRYPEAAAAFSQCAEAPGALQATCLTAADDAKKRAAQPASAK